MSILIKIEEYFRNRKLENQRKIFEEVHSVLTKINTQSRGSDDLVFSLCTASDYQTLKFMLDRVIVAATKGLGAKSITPAAKTYYKRTKGFFGFLRFLLDYNGGYVGIFWL